MARVVPAYECAGCKTVPAYVVRAFDFPRTVGVAREGEAVARVAQDGGGGVFQGRHIFACAVVEHLEFRAACLERPSVIGRGVLDVVVLHHGTGLGISHAVALACGFGGAVVVDDVRLACLHGRHFLAEAFHAVDGVGGVNGVDGHVASRGKCGLARIVGRLVSVVR